ncbi:MAG: hypothetical protein KBG15_01020 [Kofleriaceae bacterium]|nr:hypothetical protein [Kofleriaceae bacterium]
MKALRSMLALAFALAFALLSGCTQSQHRAGREEYNAGLAALAAGNLPEAEKRLLAARDQSIGDPDLMFRANYNLGIAYLQDGDRRRADKDPDPAKALELYEQAIGWLRAAIKERSTTGGAELANAQANLVIALAKRSALSDELRKGDKKIEQRLDAVIALQRGILDEAQAAWAIVKTEGTQNPLAGQAELTALANSQRGAGAEAGVVVDMAADEIDEVGKKPEDKRSQEEQVRLLILRNVDLYLLDARARMAEARRKFQELSSEPGLEKSEAALVALKRAREQFLDPIAVLRAVGQDQLELVRITAQLAQVAAGQNRVQRSPAAGSASAPAESAMQLPAWFEPKALALRQAGLHERVGEVLGRLTAAFEAYNKQVAATASPSVPPAAGSGALGSAATPAPEPAPAVDAASIPDPKQVKLMAGIGRALPMVQAAQAAMVDAKNALGEAKHTIAQVAQTEALRQIARAVEEFSDLRGLIEVAHGEQSAVVTLLGPEAVNISAQERGVQTRDGLRKNIDRSKRMTSLIGEELGDALRQIEQAAAQAQAPQGAAGPANGTGAGSGAPDPAAAATAAAAQREQTQKLYAQAELLRGEIEKLLIQTQRELESGKDPTSTAKVTLEKIAELRRLFFSVIEHLKELIATQGETRDQTVAAGGKDEVGRAAVVPGIVPRQQQHIAMAQGIGEVLAKQADQAEPGQGGGTGGPGKKQLTEAAEEVRQASTAMTEVVGKLQKVVVPSTISRDFEPISTGQGKALEHLQKALALLEPPKQQNQDQQDQKDQKDQQDPKDSKDQKDAKDSKDQKDSEESKAPPQNGTAGQRARDDEAKRQRKRQEQQSREAPVEKDW